MGKYEVTNGQYQTFVRIARYDGAKESDSDYLRHHRDWSKCASTQAQFPIVCVSWKNTVAFCRWLSQQSGVEARLPTEAQWEYACRAGTRTRFSFGDDLNYRQLGEYAWYTSNSGSKTHPAGQKKPNPWCLYDMHGNVWEWCSSKYASYPYRAGEGREDLGDAGSRRVVRGGGWIIIDYYCRSASRYYYTPSGCHNDLGLRVCVSARAPQ